MTADRDAALAGLAPYAETVRFGAGDCIFAAGSPGDCFYLIESGQVRVVQEPDGADLRSPGTLLGGLSLLARSNQPASAFAKTDVVLRRVSRAAFEWLTMADPAAGLAVVAVLVSDDTCELPRHSCDAGPDRAPEVDGMVAAAAEAQERFASWSEERVDALLHDIAVAVAGRADELAHQTVQETGIGNPSDKVEKIRFAALGVYASLAEHTGAGPLTTDDERGVTEIASPVGVVFGLAPVTEPVGTFVNKALICLKARNSLILSCQRCSRGVGAATGTIIQDVLRCHGAPPCLVQWVLGPSSREQTRRFMTHPGIGLIFATGGPSMVKAAYSSGKPAIGVGAGNTPAWVCADADLMAAAQSIVASKSFDFGVACGSEQHVIVDRAVKQEFLAHLVANGAAVLGRAQTTQLLSAVLDPTSGQLKRRFIGRPAGELAEAGGVRCAPGIRLLALTMDPDEARGGAARERAAPVLSLFTVRGDDEAVRLCQQLLNCGGAGHTAVIHTKDMQRVERFAHDIRASRILVNVPAAHGSVGAATGLSPSLSLGCGTFGGNSTTDNVTYRNVRNIKRIALPSRSGGRG